MRDHWSRREEGAIRTSQHGQKIGSRSDPRGKSATRVERGESFRESFFRVPQHAIPKSHHGKRGDDSSLRALDARRVQYHPGGAKVLRCAMGGDGGLLQKGDALRVRCRCTSCALPLCACLPASFSRPFYTDRQRGGYRLWWTRGRLPRDFLTLPSRLLSSNSYVGHGSFPLLTCLTPQLLRPKSTPLVAHPNHNDGNGEHIVRRPPPPARVFN